MPFSMTTAPMLLAHQRMHGLQKVEARISSLLHRMGLPGTLGLLSRQAFLLYHFYGTEVQRCGTFYTLNPTLVALPMHSKLVNLMQGITCLEVQFASLVKALFVEPMYASTGQGF